MRLQVQDLDLLDQEAETESGDDAVLVLLLVHGHAPLSGATATAAGHRWTPADAAAAT